MPEEAPVTTTVASWTGAGRAMRPSLPMTSRAAPRLSSMGQPLDLVFVDVLLRRQLRARREGRSLVLRNVPDDLRELLELLGLDEVLVLEPRRQAEVGEQLRIDEVVQPGDRAV